MKRSIIQMSHIQRDIKKADEFSAKVAETIGDYQSRGLQVEIQYQQSDSVLSALILGRMEV